MSKILTPIFLFFISAAMAQLPGDTIKVKTFHYKSNTRDTVAAFPKGNLTFEKIIMKYNMRCKNALISNSTDRNLGCGEWDYSCNTYIIDSSKIEEATSTTPNYKISNFSGTTFSYTNTPLFDYYDFTQKNVVVNNVISENFFKIGSGTSTNLPITSVHSAKYQHLYTAAELSATGFTAGNIDGLVLNVINTGGSLNFLKLGIKHTTQNKLVANTIELSSFTEVHNGNYSFVNGDNKIQFYTPFSWNGTSNILIEYSYTNTGKNNEVVFKSYPDTANMTLYAQNNTALDLSSSGHVSLNTSMLSFIDKELTVSFWAYGKSSAMPTETSILYGHGADANQRNLNLHLPWSDNNMYYDCGYGGGGFDRINKVATAAEQGGQWNHWTFTKNATTGNMKIYLNGTLWTSGTGKTKPIKLLTLILGKDKDFQKNYKGKINELTIWNKELAAADILSWITNPFIDASHPHYTNLLAYYNMAEGIGQSITDKKNNLSSIGSNFEWTYERGDKLNRTFYKLNIRPEISFIRGTYNLTVTNVIVRDSIARNANTVEQFNIISKAGEVPVKDDIINLGGTTYLYENIELKIYNGDNGLLKSTIPVTATGTLNITPLSYVRRFPFYDEILSFVTPYGIGLDLGVNGKSWYYDLTDYAPLLKNNKRIQMTQGGQNQEQMDVEFYFIVGTPVRTVLEFNQIWQGTSRAGSASIGSINNETRFESKSVPTLSNGKYFKVRSVITGHGQEGEFDQSGGLVDHMLNINGGNTDFTWNITQECAFNPVFPQGGTWVYDRQGWCPGMVSTLKENDITNLVTAGSNTTIDYNTSTPQNATGDYRYLASHQLITYGDPSYTLDAAVIDILSPTDKIEYGRTNPMCNNPQIKIQNTGYTNITTIKFEYWVNSSTNIQDYTWTGNLAFLETALITLPVYHLFSTDMLIKGNKFNVSIKSANAVADNYFFNNKLSSNFDIPPVMPGALSFEFKTNNNPTENSFKLFDWKGKIIDDQTFTVANKIHIFTYDLNGCYKLVVEDGGQDGLNWWASPSQGAGYARMRKTGSSVVKTFQADFGGGFEYNFTTNWSLINDKVDFENIFSIYPNPTNNNFTLEGADLNRAQVKVIDVLGHTINLIQTRGDSAFEFNTFNLAKGVYFVVISKDGLDTTKKVVIY